MATGVETVDDRLVWTRAAIQGRPVVYGIAGAGAPVLFLHGWALGHHAYKRVLRRVARRSSLVLAPALPGFGGTADLPRAERTIAGYAAWVAAFLDEVGITEPATVIGHSFGGGVSIALAHDHPDRVSQLVLVNSVGGGGTGERGDLADRPLWDWALQFAKDLRPGPQTVRTLRDMREDLLPNVVRNPRALWDVGGLARRADLRAELAELRLRALPVVVVSGTDDSVIPTSAFEALCGALGTEGTLLPGNHMWLLTNPDAFDEVMGNVLGSTADDVVPASPAEELRALLSDTTIPAAMGGELVAEAPPLWLASDAPADLAGDLALCHPPLATGEVRARVSVTATTWRLTVVANDRPGLLANTAGVLANEGFSISSASVASWEGPGLALHAVTVEGRPPRDDALERIGSTLRSSEAGADVVGGFVASGRASVELAGTANGDPILTIDAADRPGLLWAICRWLADHDASIQAAWIASDDDTVHDVFVVRGDIDPAELAEHLSAPTPARRPCPLLQLVDLPFAVARALARP
jgi:pimeloyl-ACP methyl ester carboxylesterase/glycine cleavage system regulatory protein